MPTPEDNQPRAAGRELFARAALFRREAATLTQRADKSAETVVTAAYRDLARRWLTFAAHLEAEAMTEAQPDDADSLAEPDEPQTLQCAPPAFGIARDAYSMKFL